MLMWWIKIINKFIMHFTYLLKLFCTNHDKRRYYYLQFLRRTSLVYQSYVLQLQTILESHRSVQTTTTSSTSDPNRLPIISTVAALMRSEWSLLRDVFLWSDRRRQIGLHGCRQCACAAHALSRVASPQSKRRSPTNSRGIRPHKSRVCNAAPDLNQSIYWAKWNTCRNSLIHMYTKYNTHYTVYMQEPTK